MNSVSHDHEPDKVNCEMTQAQQYTEKRHTKRLSPAVTKENVFYQNITTIQEAHLAPDYTRDKVNSPG